MKGKGAKLKSICGLFLIVTILGTMLTGNMKVLAVNSDVNGFVTRLYEQCLNREPDNVGLDYWVNRLNTNVSSGADIAQNFIFSPEFVSRNVANDQFLDIMYTTFFNRQADASGKDYWLNKLNNGYSRFVVLAFFANSSEFTNVCTSYNINRGNIVLTKPADMHPDVASFVYRFYSKCLGRIADDGGLNYWVGILTNGKSTGADLSLGFTSSTEFLSKNLSDTDYVATMYQVFFDRAPDAGGQSYWEGKIADGNSRRFVLASFVSSQEFKDLCSSYGINNGVISVPPQQTIDLIKIGSSESDVLRILGQPSSESYTSYPLYSYTYNGSTLFLLNGSDGLKVVGWWNFDGNLKVTTGNIVTGSKPFTYGSSKEEVARVMGTPRIYDPYSYLSPGRWTYWEYANGSRVDFNGNSTVNGWTNKGNLQVNLGTKLEGASPVKLGSTLDEVTAVLGTPTSLETSSITELPYHLNYNEMSISLNKDGKVVGWQNKGTFNINIGEKNPAAPAVVVGSSFQDVINAEGTPDSLTYDSFNDKPYMLEYKTDYGKLVYYLDEFTQVVKYWDKLDPNNRLIETSRQ